MDTAYRLNQEYKGSKNVCVSTRMYSCNKLLSALHIKSKRWLCVNLERYVMTFHHDSDSTNHKPENEIAFSKIRSIDADVT